MQDGLPRVMTPKMIAEVWHCSERHVYKLIETGELPSFRAGSKLIRVKGADVEAYELRSADKTHQEAPLALVRRLSPIGRARIANLRRVLKDGK